MADREEDLIKTVILEHTYASWENLRDHLRSSPEYEAGVKKMTLWARVRSSYEKKRYAIVLQTLVDTQQEIKEDMLGLNAALDALEEMGDDPEPGVANDNTGMSREELLGELDGFQKKFNDLSLAIRRLKARMRYVRSKKN